MLPPDSQPPPLPSASVRARKGYGGAERLAWPWKIALAFACLAFCALVARLIQGYTIVEKSDAFKADASTVHAADKRLQELKYRARFARTPRQRCEAQYLILAEIKTLPAQLSGYSRAVYEKMRAISEPLNDATLAYDKNVSDFFGAGGKWLSIAIGAPEEISQARERMKTLAAENQNLRARYRDRIVALARETDSGRRNGALAQIYLLAEDKKSAYNFIRDSDARIYETLDALLQLLVSNEGHWQGTRLQLLRWDSTELARQSNALFDELAILFSQQSDAQLELLGLAWND